LWNSGVTHGVHGGEHRRLEVTGRDRGLARLDARVVVADRRLGRGRREHQLPGERRAVRRILVQDVVQDRGARAREADDEDRFHDVDLRDLRVPLPVAHIVQPILHVQEDALFRDVATDVVEPGFGVQ